MKCKKKDLCYSGITAFIFCHSWQIQHALLFIWWNKFAINLFSVFA
ncbi:hypothetical protein HMPREF0198_1079 [Cardiobacterium hominis ATCC 15826]|uniref:Uncharacterized protein n=1 Tax=Cardiobacterium hominis (strain ATCC 15826 / DSM 8339 / NCTC 10426 / 6573) TaxID=638300 RepID=C8N9A1_CARH6|nr:hypothetical protein HMPREF0198_1079 [Cardiobacterium hominis ATCC 15826]